MPRDTTDISPRPSVSRPPLPYTHVNPFLTSCLCFRSSHTNRSILTVFFDVAADGVRTPTVKYQIITRDSQEIVVCRLSSSSVPSDFVTD